MNKPKKEIDVIFKDKLQNHEVTPDPALWAKISEKLPQKEKKRKAVLWWFLPVGIAASFLLFLFLQTPKTVSVEDYNEFVFEEDPEEECTPINLEVTAVLGLPKLGDEKESTKESVSKKNVIKAKKERAVYTTQQKSIATAETVNNPFNVLQKTIKNNNLKETSIEREVIKNQEADSTIKGLNTSANDELDIIAAADTLQKIDENLIINNITGVQNDEKNESESFKNFKRKWSIQPQIAPLVYNSISGNSSIEANFQNNVASTNAGISYGVKIAYQASSKWQIRSGISTANVAVFTNQITDQSLFRGGVSSIQFEDFENELSQPQAEPLPQSEEVVNESPSPIVVEDSEQQPTNSDAEIPTANATEGILQQQINYIEIPVEFTYQILNKRFGATFIGGVSTFILNQNNNEIFFEESGNKRLVGSSNNLNNTSFSGNVGIGLNYKITDKIKINIEPTIKIQFNAFDKSTDFNPYIFGVYSGIILKL